MAISYRNVFGAAAVTLALARLVAAQGPLSSQMLEAPSTSAAVAIADFDGDGRADVATASDSQVLLLLARGQGTFAPAVTLNLPTTIPAGWPQLAVGDFDGDGRPDLAFATGYYWQPGGELHLLRNIGGAFALSASVNISSGANELLAADLDGDGKLDLAASGFGNAGNLFLARGDGSGGLSTPLTLPLAAAACDLALGDLDADQDLDLVVAYQSGGFDVLLNQGALNFVAGASFPNPFGSDSVVTGDFDGDGDLDVIVDRVNGSTLELRLNDGHGVLGAATLFGSLQVRELQARDLDGNGTLDLAAHDLAANGRLDIGLNLGGGNFGAFQRYQGPGTSAGSFEFDDLDGDGRLDCLFGTVPSGLVLMSGNGAGVFGLDRLTLDGKGSLFQHADFDHDGREDLAIVSGTPARLSVAMHQPSGGFATTTVTNPADARSMCTGDFDGDGNADVALVGAGGTTHVYIGDGAGGFGAPVDSLIGSGSMCAATDLNGDGLDDLVIAYPWGVSPPFNSYPAGVFYCIATGGGTFGPGAYFYLPTAPIFYYVEDLVTADFDGDGRGDVAMTTEIGCLVFHGPSGSFAMSTLLAGTSTSRVAAARLDPGNSVDLVIQGDNGTMQSALGNGLGSFALSAPIPLTTTWARIDTGDFDSDGDTDIACLDGAGVVCLMTGDGLGGLTVDNRNFASMVTAVVPLGEMHALDVDLDGRIDLACIDKQLPVMTFVLQQNAWEHPDAYCTAKTTSNGCVPAIAWSGTPSATATSGFTVACANAINNKSGILFYSLTGRAEIPFQGGTLCVRGPRQRTPLRNSGGNSGPNDCSGNFALDFNAFAHGLAGGSPSPALTTPGIAVTAQWWGRDPLSPPPGATMLSNALDFLVGP